MKEYFFILLSFIFWMAFTPPAFADPAPFATWYDGDQPSPVWVDFTRVAKVERNAQVRVTLRKVTRAADQKTLARGRMPAAFRGSEVVFRNAANGGQRMVAVGNVLVRFSPTATESSAKDWIDRRGRTLVERPSYDPQAYIIQSEAGVAAIELANEWRKDPEVASAEPIWWQESVPR